jgi:phosphatidylinositol glycan class B
VPAEPLATTGEGQRGAVAALLRRGGLDDLSWRRFLARWLGASLVLILIAALRSDGFHHPDEYFQTLEFASAKLGRTPFQDLPWEYAYRMRSWLQPGLYYVVARGLGGLGVGDPFAWSFSFRLISGLLGWVSIAALALCVPHWLPENEQRRAAIRALSLGFFVPYLAVRTSSESLAGSCFILGMSLLVLTGDGRPKGRVLPLGFGAIGFLFGLAFEFRYAMGIAVVAITVWAALVARVRGLRLLGLALGFLIALALGALIDRWGYGAWTFPPYEYLITNLVQGRAAGEFGELPFYGYFLLAVMSPAAPFLLILMAATLLGSLRKPLHPLSWAAGPFFVAHSLIGHKELRFLFPLALLSLVFLVLALAPQGDRWDRWVRPVWSRRAHPLARVLLACNVVGLGILCFAPMRPQVSFQRFVRHHFPKRFEAHLLTPFSPWVAGKLSMHFYRPETLVLHPLGSLAEVERQGLPRFLVITGSFDPPPSLQSGYSCKALYRSLPYFMRELFPEGAETIPAWDLYRCLQDDAKGSGRDPETSQPPSSQPPIG